MTIKDMFNKNDINITKPIFLYSRVPTFLRNVWTKSQTEILNTKPFWGNLTIHPRIKFNWIDIKSAVQNGDVNKLHAHRQQVGRYRGKSNL